MARFQHILFKGITPLFIVWRILDFVVAYFAPNFLPYLGNFSHPKTLNAYVIPTWIKEFAQFDGIFYLRIAQNGYSQFEQAFFPLYPLLIRALSPIFANNYLVSSLLISNLSFFIGLIVLKKYLERILPKSHHKDIQYIILALLLFPTSFFFGASYTESLFFLLIVSTFYFLSEKNYALVAISAFLASLTRFIGLFLFVPLAVAQLQQSLQLGSVRDTFKFSLNKKYLVVLSPFLGLCTYIYYLWKTTGDPFAFFNSQTAFGAGRSTHLILLPQVLYRYIKILLTAQLNIGYFVALLELSFFIFVFAVLSLQLKDILKSKNKALLGLNLFSFANIIIPTLTGTLLSIPRFSLLSLSVIVYLGLLKSARLKTFICLIFLLLHVALVTLFIQGYFVS